MTVDNVTQILNKISGEEREVMSVLGLLGVPGSLLEEIQRRCSTDTEKNHACGDYYVNCYPWTEWEDLTKGLYWKKEFAAARESKAFISTGKYCTISYSYAQVEYHILKIF